MTTQKKREYRIGGRVFSFNFKEFQNWNKRLKWGGQAKAIKLLTEKGIASRTAYYAWLREESAPSDIETVRRIEDLLSLPPDKLLTEIVLEKETTEAGNMKERIIDEQERNSARKTYERLCDMIRGLEYFDPDQWLKHGYPTTPKGFRYLGRQTQPFDYRDEIIVEIRKAGFDFPKRMRDQLISFVRDAFGEGCYETGLMYFESREYKEYLEKNKLENTPEVRELYSNAYIEGLYEKLDGIFEEYLF